MTNILGEKHIFLTHTSIHEVLIFLCTCFWAGSLTLELGFVTARQHGGLACRLVIGWLFLFSSMRELYTEEREWGRWWSCPAFQGMWYFNLHSSMCCSYHFWNTFYFFDQFLGRDKEKEEGAQRSAISGKKVRKRIKWRCCFSYERILVFELLHLFR